MDQINKILLFGSSGMLGRYIHCYFAEKIEIIPLEYKIANQNNFDALEPLLNAHHINERTCVINCIGFIPQRKQPNQTDKDYFIINGIFPNILWEICKKYNAKMIQPSTDCVFSGRKGNYIETVNEIRKACAIVEHGNLKRTRYNRNSQKGNSSRIQLRHNNHIPSLICFQFQSFLISNDHSHLRCSF